MCFCKGDLLVLIKMMVMCDGGCRICDDDFGGVLCCLCCYNCCYAIASIVVVVVVVLWCLWLP